MEYITGLLNDLLSVVMSLLPDSPFNFSSSDFATSGFVKTIQQIKWFFPVNSMIKITAVWITCIATFYIYQTVLRTMNAIS